MFYAGIFKVSAHFTARLISFSYINDSLTNMFLSCYSKCISKPCYFQDFLIKFQYLNRVWHIIWIWNLIIDRKNAISTGTVRFGQGQGPIWMDDVSCQGTENDIFDCNKTLVNHNCDHSDDAGVICSKSTSIFYRKIHT